MITLVTTFFTLHHLEWAILFCCKLSVDAVLYALLYFMDGFAYAGEAPTGRYVGAKTYAIALYD